MTVLSAFKLNDKYQRFRYETEETGMTPEGLVDYVQVQWLGRSCGARLRDATKDATPLNTQGIVMYEGDVFADYKLPEKHLRDVVHTKNGDLTFFIDQRVR